MSEAGRRVRLVSLALATLVALALFEIGARWLVPVREIGPSFSLYDPILGSRHKVDLRATRWTPEFTMHLSTNSRGQRGPEPTPSELAAKSRVVFVGDSFTEGYGVDDGEEFARLIAAQLRAGGRDVRVLNEGVGNTGTGRALRLVRGYADEAGLPTVLVYQSSANDFGDDLRDGFFRLGADGELVEAPVPVPRSLLRRIQPVVDRIPGLSHSHVFAAVMQIARSRRSPDPATAASMPASDAERERLTLRLLAELIATARDRGWPVVVLCADALPEVASSVGQVARESGAAFVAMPDKSARPDLYYRIDGHWNRSGHVEAARRLRAPIEGALDQL